MTLLRTVSVLLAGGLIPAFASAQGNVATKTQTAASQIVCPLQELEWGVAQTFPDPWWAPSYKVPFAHGPETAQGGAAKGMLYCSYQFASKQNLQLPQTGWETETGWVEAFPDFGASTKIFVIRPTYPGIAQSQWPCPANIQVKTLSPLPSPWLGTHFWWPLTKKWSHNPNWFGAQDVCEYTQPQNAGQPFQIYYPLEPPNPVAQTGMTGLAANPVTLPVMDNLAQTFFVTKAQLTAIPKKLSTSCPTTVRFEGRIATNGSGQVKYRSEINGQAGPLQTLTYNAMGEKVVKFETQVAPAQQQAGGLTLTTQAQSSNVVNGQARIVIESPQGVSESNFASYEITCTPLAPAGNLTQTPLPPPPPAPPQAIAQPTAPTDPAPTAIAAAPQRSPARTSQPQAVAAPVMAAATAALPDLYINASEINRARPTVLRVQVVNGGQGASAATRLRVSTGDGKEWFAPVPALTPGQETWVLVRADAALASAQSVLARVDEPNRVKESDEDNNDHKVK